MFSCHTNSLLIFCPDARQWFCTTFVCNHIVEWHSWRTHFHLEWSRFRRKLKISFVHWQIGQAATRELSEAREQHHARDSNLGYFAAHSGQHCCHCIWHMYACMMVSSVTSDTSQFQANLLWAHVSQDVDDYLFDGAGVTLAEGMKFC